MKDTTLLFTLTDTDGIKSRDPVRLVLVPLLDQPPQMAVQLDGIGTAVTAGADPRRRPVTDDYGLGRVWFEHAIDQQKPGRRAIGEFRTAPRSSHGLQSRRRRAGVAAVGIEAGPEAVAERQGGRPL